MSFELEISPQVFAAIAAGLVALRWAAEFALSKLNEAEVRRKQDQIPAAFEGMIDQETYKKSVRYTLAGSRFGTIKGIWDTLILLAILFSGILPTLFEFSASRLGTNVWGSALTLFGLGIAPSLTSMPWDYYDQFKLEQRFGFNTTTIKTWITDRVKGIVISAILGIPLIAFLLKTVEIAGSYWWIWAWVGVIGFQFLVMLLAPAIIMPWFNKFTPLPDGDLKDRLWELARRTGFTAQAIQIMDGSRRSKHSNAFFTGFGRHRKIVLYDTLTEQLNPDELEAVLAHEIGHFKLKHIPKLLVTSAIGLLGFFYALHVLSSQWWFYEAFGFAPGNIAPAIFIFFLLAGTVSFWITPLTNGFSRKHEYEADAFAVAAVQSAEPLCSSLRRLSEKNLSNLTPHPIFSAFYYSHPTLAEREQAMRRVANGA